MYVYNILMLQHILNTFNKGLREIQTYKQEPAFYVKLVNKII